MKKCIRALTVSMAVLAAVVFCTSDIARTQAVKQINSEKVPLATYEGGLSLYDSVPKKEKEERDKEGIEVVMVGDMLMHTRVIDSGRQEDGTFNYDHLFSNVRSKVEGADLAIVNQETILGGSEIGISDYPNFNSPYEVGDAEVNAGFDVVLSATNHALDKGKKGLTNCLNFWETTYPEIALLGIHESQEDADQIYVYEQDGIKIAVLNYTFSTNGISTPEGMSYAVDYLEEDKVVSDIERANEMADFTIVCPHWGTEYQLSASSYQKKWCQIFLENGVDLVIGTHPHVIQPVTWYSDSKGNKMLVYYSLGNFVNGTKSKGADVGQRMVGGMADVYIDRDKSGNVVISDYSVIPLVCHEADKAAYTVYYLKDYTKEMAEENWIVDSDSEFSLDYCWELVEKVWNNMDFEVEN